MILFPHAKVNLGLDITGRLPNGYHTLETVMIHTDWEDLLELTPAKETELVCSGHTIACLPDQNLVMKAYRALADELGGLPPTRIHLHKNIPDGAGLGGGSADVAYTLRGLNELYNLGVDNDKLAAVAAKIGSDCPFFIYDTPMLCTGTGTTLTPIDLKGALEPYTLAIVKPDVNVSTKEAYAGVKPFGGHRAPLVQRLDLPVERWQETVTNDFEPSVVFAHPIIGQIKADLMELGAVYAAMSGSGSALFALFPKTDSAILADLLGSKFPDCICHVARR